MIIMMQNAVFSDFFDWVVSNTAIYWSGTMPVVELDEYQTHSQ